MAKVSDFPYLHSYKSRTGREFHYFRYGSQSRIRLPEPGTPEFIKAYQAARSGLLKRQGGEILPSTVGAKKRKSKTGHERRVARGSAGGVYLLMRGATIVYVGSSADMVTRVMAHKLNGRRFDRAYYIKVPPNHRSSLESTLIAALQPEQNRAGKTKAETDGRLAIRARRLASSISAAQESA